LAAQRLSAVPNLNITWTGLIDWALGLLQALVPEILVFVSISFVLLEFATSSEIVDSSLEMFSFWFEILFSKTCRRRFCNVSDITVFYA
jgi:hypothetical protein